jgi:L-lysine exporter family protein LysE/ArgO
VPLYIPFLAGLGLGFSLIIAIGAQNLFVLRQGMRREHIWLVIAICALSDAVLIAVGVSGIGAALAQLPVLVTVVRWTGAAFLIVFGVLAARRALRREREVLEVADADGPTPNEADAPSSAASAGRVQTMARTAPRSTVATHPVTSGTAIALTTLALTWLNPHVYLDTLFLLGSLANTWGDDRWRFAAGAVLASVTWFMALGVGSRFLGRLLHSPRAWRILDGVIAIVMIGIGVSLVLPL